MKTGLHMGYWWGTQYENDIKMMIELTAKTGVDYIEVNPRYFLQLTSSERVELRKFAEGLGIKITVNGGPGKDADLAGDSEALREAGIEFSKRMIEAIKDFNAPTWSGVMYSQWLRKPAGVWPATRDEILRARDYCVQSLTKIGDMLDDCDCVCCLEIVNRYEQFLMNTSEDGVAIAEATGRGNIQLLLDTFHMNIEEDDIASALAYADRHKRLGHIHAGESNRRVPRGGGNIRWEEIGEALKKINYDKIIMMEPFVLASANNAHNTCVWRNLAARAVDIGEMVETARAGSEFLRALVK